MKKQYFKLGLILIMTLLLQSFSVIQAFAQTPVEVGQLYSEVLPEYDKPEILVVNTITFKNTSNQDYTGPLKWYIPKGANTLLIFDETNPKENITPNILQNIDYGEVDWTLKTPLKVGENRNIHLEYYYNNIQGTPDKKFTFDLISPYQITNSQIVIGQPTKATNFKIDPVFGQPSVNKGISYYSKVFQNLSAGQKQTINVSYTKGDSSLSAPRGQSQQTQPGTGSNTYTTSLDSKKLVLIAALIILIVILIILVLRLINNKKILTNFENAAASYTDDDEEEAESEDEIEEENPKKKSNIDEAQLSKEQIKLQEQLKKGLITEDQYYEKLLEIE